MQIDSIPQNSTDAATLFIDGVWRPAASGRTREIRCPADGQLVGIVAEADAADTTAAIAAARNAFDAGAWANTPTAERADLLLRVADLLVHDKDLMARAESLDTGKRLVESEYDIDDIVSVFRHYGNSGRSGESRAVDTGTEGVESTVVHEPVGVCALITPWNYPILQVAWKVAPCLLAGNTFVLKPSELTPHTAIHLMRLLAEAGLPAGVGNLVLGAGAEAGAPLSVDPKVDLVSFTGGLQTGKALMVNAAATVKKIALELGGKNPNVVFADADREAALDNALTAVFLHSGQVCSAGARLIIEESIKEDFVAELVERASQIKIGGPFDADAETGALISKAHLDKVAAYVDAARAEGAVVRLGGAPLVEGQNADGTRYADGYFYPPTVLDGCNTSMTCVQDESFGPVLTVETFATEEDAIRLANDSIYGLAGAVWSQDGAKADRVAAKMRMGTVWINDYHPYVAQAEWGGYKQSGIGRELGNAGLEEYRETKHVWKRAQPIVTGWFGGESGVES